MLYDDVIFDGSVTNADCVDMNMPRVGNHGVVDDDGDGGGETTPRGVYSSIQLINGYSGHVELVGRISTDTFELTSGNFDQMAATDTLAIFQHLDWTSGTFNSTTNLSAMILEAGCIGEVPTDASVTTGSNIVLAPGTLADGGAKLTFDPGTTVNFCNAAGMDVGDKGKIVVATSPTGGDVVFAGGKVTYNPADPSIIIEGVGEIQVEGGGKWESKIPLDIRGGNLGITGLNTNGTLQKTIAQFEGNIGSNTDPLSVLMSSGRIMMLPGSQLEAENTIRLAGGRLSTEVLAALTPLTAGGATTATIKTPRLDLTGADVVFCATLNGTRVYTAGLQNLVAFDTILVLGDVYWSDGEMKMCVSHGDSEKHDTFRVNGKLVIDKRGEHLPTISPDIVDAQGDYLTVNTPPVGAQFWDVILADGDVCGYTEVAAGVIGITPATAADLPYVCSPWLTDSLSGRKVIRLNYTPNP